MGRTLVFVSAWAWLITGFAAAPAVADMLYFEASNIVSPDHPTVTITAWADFDPKWYAMASASFEFHCAESGLAGPKRLLKGPGTFDGWLSPDTDEVTGIRAGQLHFPSAGIFADTANPIALWSITWTAEQFHPRQVDLWTGLPTRWDLYTSDDGTSGSFLYAVSVEHGSITVVPASGVWPVVGGLVMLRRRRRGGRAI